ncbi:hypothetical protein H9P43_001254 [Blastocladiella emersonii ATCC 22665]|nr:hypothetical protein H9P43_001254 [Blastocladiella emersonii ATCC 22665]
MTTSATSIAVETSFRDRFGAAAATYSKSRPTYPPELYAYLASVAPGRAVGIDVGCGSGQASRNLVDHFDRVIACDGSEGQIAQARQVLGGVKGLEFHVTTAESLTKLADKGSVDLITVAQAIHWFDLPTFYAQADTLLRPGGILAAWTYPIPSFLDEPALNTTFHAFYQSLHAEGFWDGIIRKYVDSLYADLPWPYPSLDPAPAPWRVERAWQRTDLDGFLASWSAVGNAKRTQNRDVIAEWADRFDAAWPKGKTEVKIEWSIHMKVGRKPE